MGGPVRFVRREGSGLFPRALLFDRLLQFFSHYSVHDPHLETSDPLSCPHRAGPSPTLIGTAFVLVIVEYRRTPRVCSSPERGPMATLVHRVHVHVPRCQVHAPSLRIGNPFLGHVSDVCTDLIIEHLPDSHHGHVIDESRFERGTALLGHWAVHGRCEGRTAGGRRSRECDGRQARCGIGREEGEASSSFDLLLVASQNGEERPGGKVRVWWGGTRRQGHSPRPGCRSQ